MLLSGLLAVLLCLDRSFAEAVDARPESRESLLLALETLGLGEVDFPDRIPQPRVKPAPCSEPPATTERASQKNHSAEHIVQWVGTLGAMFLLMRTLLRR
jgi:hypothetical protein